MRHVRKILQALKKADFWIKRKKSEFYVQSVSFLEFIIMNKELRINLKKVEAVINWLRLTNKTKTRSLLNFLTYYRKFIKRFSRIVLFITNFTKKNTLFIWTKKAKKAFVKLKKLFICQSVLIMFESRKLIVLETNASDQVIEVCINQLDDKKRLHLIAFHSKKLTNAKLNYEIHNKKLLIIVNSFKQ